MPSSTDIPTFSELLQFAKSRQAHEYETIFQEKPFHVFVKNEELYFRPVGSVERRARTHRINEVLDKLRLTASWKPGDYSDDSFNASYLLSLVKAWQTPELTTRPNTARDSERAQLTPEQKEKLKSVVKTALRPRDCILQEERLVHGFQIELRPAIKNKWIGSVYWSENNLENDVEVAFDSPRLAITRLESASLTQWFTRTALLLQSAAPRNHSGDNEAWFRAGFRYADAIEFFRRLAKQTDPLTHGRDRWVYESSSSQPPSPPEHPQQSIASPEERALSHMLAMAKAACSQSGEVRTSVAKEKCFRFESDAQFRAYVAGLLAKQNNRCAITNLSLFFDEGGGDEECLASLDRISSDGHYEAGNLQIVCRFVNRWKSDADDLDFRRLIGLLRQEP